MSQPTASSVHVDQALTNISVAYAQNEQNFIADKVFPIVSVNNKTNKFHKFVKNDWFRDDAVKLRAPGSESAGSGFTMTTDTYAAEVWSTHVDIDDETRANADPSVPVEIAAARLVTQRMMLRRERLFATNYMTTSIWDTDSTPSNLWDAYGSSDPADDIDTGRRTILANTGFEPNTFVVSFDVHQALKKHPLILERYKYTSSESATPAVLANYFEVDRYLIAKSVYATNAENGTEAYDFNIGKHALLCYVNPNPSIMTPSAGYDFVWSGLSGLNNLGMQIKNLDLRPIDKNVDRIVGDFAFDQKVVSSDLGYFFNSAVS